MCDMTHSQLSTEAIGMTHSHIWHDSLTCDITHSHVWHDMTHSHVWHDSFADGCRGKVRSSSWSSHVTHVSLVTCEWVMSYASTDGCRGKVRASSWRMGSKSPGYAYITRLSWLMHMCDWKNGMKWPWYSLLHLECYVISISNFNLLGLFSTERDERDLEK